MLTSRIPGRTRRSIVLVALMAAVALAASCGESGDQPNVVAEQNIAPATAPDTKLITPADAAALLKAPPSGLVLLDVRTPDEYGAGHLAGATMINFSNADFIAKVSQLDRATPYLLYCRSGNRSGQAIAAMAKLGFTNLTDLEGGVQAWSAAGLPLVQA